MSLQIRNVSNQAVTRGKVAFGNSYSSTPSNKGGKGASSSMSAIKFDDNEIDSKSFELPSSKGGKGASSSRAASSEMSIYKCDHSKSAERCQSFQLPSSKGGKGASSSRVSGSDLVMKLAEYKDDPILKQIILDQLRMAV